MENNERNTDSEIIISKPKTAEEVKKSQRQTLNYGTIRYLAGSKTKVMLMGELESDYPICQILGIGKSSKFEVGKNYKISRSILYPHCGR